MPELIFSSSTLVGVVRLLSFGGVCSYKVMVKGRAADAKSFVRFGHALLLISRFGLSCVAAPR